ncbi:DUF3566 domain-containing protein [Brevibacterium otitidis]|uniref:DUF3566 domain-containing protein n=1 Tax=Brevibacterium otitidis TaxID=53364 RepID=A0ABV5X5Q9_9MICO|nr:hypothetical protein GCM10023233_33050 [Brevibacterium otitidis]
MSDSEQKPAKVIRASSGSTRLSASGSSPKSDTGASGPASTSATPATGSGNSKPRSVKAGTTRLKASSGSEAGSGPSTAAGSGPTGTGGSGPSGTSRSRSGPSGTARIAGIREEQDASSEGSVRASAGPVRMSGKTKKKGPRTVRLTVATVDPWSVMKMTFLLSLAIGIATVIAFLVLWLVLQATGTLNGIQSTLTELAGTEGADRVLGLFSLGRVLSFAVVLALVNMVLMTALSTLFAFLYNIGSTLVGGFHLKLTDD